MKECHVSSLCTLAALAAIGTGLGVSTGTAQPPPPSPEGEQGVQVLTRGPVHEAFAETVTFDAEPGIVVTMAPPNPIDEVPPDQRPEGVNVTWIPGYSAWDDERNDYLWVSGVWRAPPPGRQWVSGYWGRSSQGFQWTSGYWGDVQLSETEYLPEPPQTVEVGPSMPAPSSDHSWIPGSWIWHHGRYAWRPGYWVTVQADWNWIPAHYTWAPRGYVFVDGYWDYSVGRRGVLFAPVYFDAGIYARQGFYYSPSTVISLSVFSDHLFVRPRYHHYYFGDYYDISYQNAGFYTRFAFQSSRYGYDPIYAHQRWDHRQDRDWEIRVDADFRHRRDHADARPPRTLALQIALGAENPKSQERNLDVAVSLERLAKSQDSPVRFQRLDNEEKQRLGQRRQAVQNFREERQKLEARPVDRSADESSRESAPARLIIPRSPIVGRRGDENGRERNPPSVHKAPEPDPTVQAKPRRDRAGADATAAKSGERTNPESKGQSKGKAKRKPRDD
ncbi:MAG: BcpO-related WXXGXW repeat protein [Phycisphaerales bacterium]|nr:BcpO-related WXXGXW repeat protein [Phycisphaerales bacterium]